MDKLISAIIPCHNYGDYLDFTVNSLLDQTYSTIEIIVVNDGSTDESTRRKLATYDKPNTRVVHRAQGYPAAARNTGFQHTSGEYILVIDADDLLEKTFVEKAVDILNTHQNVGAVSSYVLKFGYNDCIWRPVGGGIDNFKYKINCGSAVLVRREAWLDAGGYNESFIENYEDWNFYIDITKRGWVIHIIPELLFYYRTKPQSRVTDLSHQRDDLTQRIIKIHPDVYAEQYSITEARKF
jgi:glycosyltransferase involved in cell wall biosynthesis